MAKLGRRARFLSRIVRNSMLAPRTGETKKPVFTTNGELGVTFIGHSGFFLQIGGRNVVVDPNFARWLFIVKRLRHPGIRIADLPAIDYVLVTHAHFDHLHRPSLRAIASASRRQSGRPPIIIVPRQVSDLVRGLGYRDVIELDWWQRFSTEAGLSITHTPSRHWGARMLRDFHRGYGGYVIQSSRHSVYHAGDTAYFPGFRDIGRRLAPELALLPIGAYSPPGFRSNHTSPADAVQAFLDLKARWMTPMHYGTFRLSQEPMEEPLQLLAREARQRNISDRVVVLEEGVTRFF
jgi:L-ascorbate metabolism protein UlaG (beta-lactamase superfamily)